jgi:ATP-dependent DNA helicase RecG
MALDMYRIEAGENQTTEFKREYTTEEIKKTIVAFANTAGGTLYIGINADKTISGVANPDIILQQIANTVRSAIKPDITMFVDCKKEKKENVYVIAVTVQRGASCPYYLAGKGFRPGGIYVRHGASSVPASETAILNMIKETDGEKYEEVRSLNQELTFNVTKQFFQKEMFPFDLNQQKYLCLQTTDGLYTNLGVLLSDQSVHTIKLAVFEGYGKEKSTERINVGGSLLRQLDETNKYLDIFNGTHAEVIGLTHMEKLDYPVEALREALLNALIHRDYSFSSSTLIDIYKDRIEFTSIGGLPKGISLDDIMLGLSVPRNEKLAKVFYLLHQIEACGTGIPKIMHSYDGYIKKPEIQTTDNAFKITLPNRNTNNRKETGYEASLNENEESVMALFDKKEEIIRKDVEAHLKISQAMAVRILHGLVEKGAVRVKGGGKKTRYTKKQITGIK